MPPSTPADLDRSSLRLSAEGITRLFGETVALWDVSLTAGSGELLEIVGPNGSGKSTLLRILAGLLHPDRGRVQWVSADARPRIDYVGHQTQLFGGLTVSETFELAARIPGSGAQRASTIRDQLGLSALGQARVASLSAGMRRRLALARALMSGGQVLIVDEPFASLDPGASAVVAAALIEHRQRGGLVLISGHLPAPSLDGASRTVALGSVGGRQARALA